MVSISLGWIQDVEFVDGMVRFDIERAFSRQCTPYNFSREVAHLLASQYLVKKRRMRDRRIYCRSASSSKSSSWPSSSSISYLATMKPAPRTSCSPPIPSPRRSSEAMLRSSASKNVKWDKRRVRFLPSSGASCSSPKTTRSLVSKSSYDRGSYLRTERGQKCRLSVEKKWSHRAAERHRGCDVSRAMPSVSVTDCKT